MKTLLCLLPLVLPATLVLNDEETTFIGKAYIEEVMCKRDFETARFLTKENMFFIDPTAHTMDMPLSEGIRGQAEIIALMQGFKLTKAQMQPKYQFSAGPYHCFIGEFSSWSAGITVPTTIPFMTCLKIEDGQVIERNDFGDYDVYIKEEARIDGITKDLEHPMVKSAKAYMKAYAMRNLEAMQALRAEDVIFHDRTAIRIGSGAAIKGNTGVTRMLKLALGGLESFGIETDYMFFHGDFAVFAGQVSYALAGEQVGLTHASFSVTHPIAVVLKIQDGKIVRHDDFCDYATYVNALAAAKKEEG